MSTLTVLDLEPRCLAFFDHWKSLRHGELVPTVENFLDRPSVQHAPQVFMVEVEGDTMIPRLHGTAIAARWSRDLTARKIHDDLDKGHLKELLANHRTVMAHPCGCYLLNEYVTASGGISRVRVIYLPLFSKPGRPPRVVGYTCELDSQLGDELFSDWHATMEAAWIDLGAGLPAFAPRLPGKQP